jgi:hypothetical protein
MLPTQVPRELESTSRGQPPVTSGGPRHRFQIDWPEEKFQPENGFKEQRGVGFRPHNRYARSEWPRNQETMAKAAALKRNGRTASLNRHTRYKILAFIPSLAKLQVLFALAGNRRRFGIYISALQHDKSKPVARPGRKAMELAERARQAAEIAIPLEDCYGQASF